MHSEMERDITEAMRMSDYNEMMIRVDKMKQDDINHGEVSVSAGYSDDGKSFVRSSTTISREDSLDNTTLHETFMPKGDSVYVTHPNDSTRGSQCQEERSFAHQRGQCAFHRPA